MKTTKLKKKRVMKLSLIMFAIFTILPLYNVAQSLSQQVICSAGGTLTNGTYYLDFSIGQTVDESFSEQGILLTQGFQQGTLNLTGISKKILDASALLTYPNPATSYLILKNNTKEPEYQLILTDIRGRVIEKQQVNSRQFSLNTDYLNPGFYLITFYFKEYQPVVRKIIKQ